MATYISKSNLIDGATYIGHCRNSDTATWNKERNCFVYARYKFGESYEDTCKHPEDDDGYDLFFPQVLASVDTQ
jgi:hypothetical protein